MVSPRRTCSASSIPWRAVNPVVGTAPACSKSSRGGRARRSGCPRPRIPRRTLPSGSHTDRPMPDLRDGMSELAPPAATTIPAPSVPGMWGNVGGPPGCHVPVRTSASHTPTPAAWRAISTSRGPGFGTGTAWSLSTSGGPNRSTAAAFIAVGRVGCRENALAVGVRDIHPDLPVPAARCDGEWRS